MTVFAQLGALRFGAKRGVISLIGTNVEYVLAEAGKTLSLRSDSRYEEGDALWHGAGALKDKAGVGHVVLQRLTGTIKKEAEPYLIVKDLEKDPQFNQLSIVKEETHARFLACYPLKTPDGFVIGMFCCDLLGSDGLRSLDILSRRKFPWPDSRAQDAT